ncbi:hypothetical protein G7046_g3542 [Stylonectria norvegica]|nr:hypothetical protein G7046_g3542 [Stylonectria norvegica]
MSKRNSKTIPARDLPVLPPLPLTGNGPHDPAEDYPGSTRSPDLESQNVLRHRFLSPTEWAIFARGVGGVKDAERHSPIHPTDWWWPPKGLPPGLYKEVVFHRTRSFYFFHLTSFLRWGFMILQLFLGAALTSLGSLSPINGTPITILGAANTIIAGLLALLHNSGLPDRYRYDMAEFDKVEDHIKEILETGIVPADNAIDQTLAECFDLFHNAKVTVGANLPVTYNSSHALQGRRSVPMTSPKYDSAPRLPKVKAGGDRIPTPDIEK